MGQTPPFQVTESKNGARLSVVVVPKASKSALAGIHGEAVKIRLAAPPVEGAANEELINFLSRALEAPKSSLSIVSGQSSRRKIVEARGLKPAQIEEKIKMALSEIEGKARK